MRYAERTVFVTPASRVTVLEDASLPVEFGRAAYGFFSKHRNGHPDLGLRDFMDLFERAVIFEALTRAGGGQTQAAKYLGLKKTTLNMKIKRHNVRFSRKPL